MKKLPSFLILFSLLPLFQVIHSSLDDSLQLNDDVLGLIVFKSSLNDPFSNLDSWNEDENSPCSWKYIQCNPVNSRVREISLDGLNLSGKIGRGLEKLQFLKVLSLSNNNFTGSITPQLANINRLEKLNLSHNSLSGNIPPSFSEMSSIQFLDLSNNLLSGSVPDTIFKNSLSLRYLSLAQNVLEGSVPSSLTRCTTLNHLNLSNNHFSGDIMFSGAVWSLTRLRTLDLSSNSLSSSLPIGISALHNLKYLSLKGNQFSGILPFDIGSCPHINTLDISDNSFTGTIPESFENLKSLEFFDISKNSFSGTFPQWISNMTSLKFLDFSGNSLEGSLPLAMGELRSLTYLGLSHNKLSGSIPESLVFCTNLLVIDLRGNTFNGSIPESLFEMGLEEIDLARNELNGSIPPGSGKFFESLQVMDLSSNKLTGEIPAEMGLFSKLRYLNLSWNNFQSRLPPELGYFQNLTVLDLRNSSLIGPIPGDICDSGSLGILQLDANYLTGSIPNAIGNCSSLYLLSLSRNNLSGLIPKSISLLKKLKILKLEFNELSGEIPQDLGKLENLLAVNISFNRLEGRLPSTFQNLDESSLRGNLGICSPLLKGPCKMNVPKPLFLNPFVYRPRNPQNEDTKEFTHHRFLSVSALVAISAAILIAFGVMIVTLLNANARRRLAFVDLAFESCSSSSRSVGPATGKLVLLDTKGLKSSDLSNGSFEAILNNATEIGEGVFGTVYKAPLGENGKMVSIKRLITSKLLQHPEEFDREVRILGKARHVNVIPLRGYFWTPQLQLLVSDYAPEGNLRARIHESLKPLTWSERFKIVLGIAKGLAYLHHAFRPPIIHYNIKPSNILLDENLNPKISDFGLAKLLTKLDKHVVNNRFQSAVGYVAPELTCQSLRVTEKCDVYGFGVLILEMITRKKPIEYGEDSVVILNDHVRVLLEQGNVLDCFDQSMGSFPEDEILPVLKLALVCTSQIPSSRPSMAEVVQILQVIKTPIPQRMGGF